MIIQAIPSGPLDTNAYVVACATTRQAAIVDPGLDSADAISNYLKKNNLQPVAIFLTHSHWDHTGNVAELQQKYHIPVLIHFNDKDNLEIPGSDKLPMFIPITPTKADRYIEEGEELSVGNLRFTVIATPGHSPGSVCFYEKQEGVLLAGDTLFRGSIGNLSFPTSEPDNMWPSLAKLAKLPANTKVYPGHGGMTTIGAESWLPQAKKIFGG